MTMFTTPRTLRAGDNIEEFDCGAAAINEWVSKYARNAAARGTAVVYATFCKESLAGVYSLSSHSVARDDVTRGWFRRNTPRQIPAILLGMLAVDVRFQHQNAGEMLLRDAVGRSQFVAHHIGAKALIVEPFDDAVTDFYMHEGFEEIPDSTRLFFRLR